MRVHLTRECAVPTETLAERGACCHRRGRWDPGHLLAALAGTSVPCAAVRPWRGLVGDRVTRGRTTSCEGILTRGFVRGQPGWCWVASSRRPWRRSRHALTTSV